jgi:hypothetical protein
MNLTENTVFCCQMRIFWSVKGRAIAQMISCWLLIAATRVRARIWSCEFCGERSGEGADFLRVIVPLPIFIPPIAPQSPSSIICGWYNRPVVAAVPCGIIILVRYLSIDVLFRASGSAGMFLPTRCLAIGIHIKIFICLTASCVTTYEFSVPSYSSLTFRAKVLKFY